MNINLKGIFYTIIAFSLTNIAQAQEIINGNTKKQISDHSKALSEGAGFTKNMQVGSILTIIIKSFFSVMGMVFLIIILHAGYKWMNAGGKKEDVEEAKESVKRAVIGLAIMIAAYAITAFIFKQLDNATSGVK